MTYLVSQDLTAHQGDRLIATVTITVDGAALDLTGCVISAKIINNYKDRTLIAEFESAVDDPTSGQVVISVSGDITATWTGAGETDVQRSVRNWAVYDVRVTKDAITRTYAAGIIHLELGAIPSA